MVQSSIEQPTSMQLNNSAFTSTPESTQTPEQAQAHWKQLARKYWFVIVLVVVLILSAILQLFTPKKSPPTLEEKNAEIPSAIGSLSNAVPITYTGDIPELPESMTIYSSDPPSLESTAQYIGNVLGMTRHKDFPSVWTSTDGNDSLSLIAQSGTIEYNHFASASATTATPSTDFSVERARESAETFMQKIGLDQSIVFNTAAATYLNDDLQPQEVVKDAAMFISIPFHYTLNSYPLAFHGQPISSTKVVVDNSLEVVKVVFTPLISSPVQVGSEKPLSIEQAVSQMKTGQNTVVSLNDPSTFRVVDLAELSSVTLTSVSLQYRYQHQSKEVIPYYSFVGRALTAQNKTIDIEILTPAIAK